MVSNIDYLFTACGCSLLGSVRDDCEQMTGRCVCKPGIHGQKCTDCNTGMVLGAHGCISSKLFNILIIYIYSQSISMSDFLCQNNTIFKVIKLNCFIFKTNNKKKKTVFCLFKLHFTV